jgi:hypothetical protein
MMCVAVVMTLAFHNRSSSIAYDSGASLAGGRRRKNRTLVA